MRFIRITKKEAKVRFNQDKPVYFCPCKMNPSGPWSMACPVFGKEHLEDAREYQRVGSDLFDGSVESTAWSLAYNNWRFYNTCYEIGYYAHYYKEG